MSLFISFRPFLPFILLSSLVRKIQFIFAIIRKLLAGKIVERSLFFIFPTVIGAKLTGNKFFSSNVGVRDILGLEGIRNDSSWKIVSVPFKRVNSRRKSPPFDHFYSYTLSFLGNFLSFIFFYYFFLDFASLLLLILI